MIRLSVWESVKLQTVILLSVWGISTVLDNMIHLSVGESGEWYVVIHLSVWNLGVGTLHNLSKCLKLL